MFKAFVVRVLLSLNIILYMHWAIWGAKSSQVILCTHVSLSEPCSMELIHGPIIMDFFFQGVLLLGRASHPSLFFLQKFLAYCH